MDCKLTTPIFITHVLTTMQTAAMVRSVFIKTTKKATSEEMKRSAKQFGSDVYRAIWEKEEAPEYHEDNHEHLEEIN